MSKRKDRLDPVHPGDVLREDFMKPLGLSAYAVAKAIGGHADCHQRNPPAQARRERGNGPQARTLAQRLTRLWMGIQADYDLEIARDRSEAGIFRRVHPLKLAEAVPA